MGRRSSAVRPGTSSTADPSSLPRRTSLRLARSSSAQTNARQIDHSSTHEDVTAPTGPVAVHQNDKPAALEVAIPLKRRTSSRSSSTSTSGNGTNDYNTPATSVAMTPAESEVPRPKTRVSASARARELHSSTMSLNPRRGRKRTITATVAEDTTPEASDAALARTLQLQEYQAPLSKRRKVLESVKSEIRDSDDDSALTELDYDDDANEAESEQWQPPRNSRGSLRSAKKPLVADSEDSNFDTDDMSQGDDDDDSRQSDQEPTSQMPSNEGRPLYSQSGSRNRSTANTRGHGRGRRQAPRSSEAAPTPSQTWMSYRAFRERKKLEKQHPYIIKMWEDLRNAPPITPVAAEQPPSISRTLKSFQLEGLNWMMRQEKSQYKGGLLGDEMGMGKTIQAVSLLMSDYPIGKPSLVVVPPVALMQWQSEIKEYTNGQLKVLVYHNSNPKVKTLAKEDLQAYDVIMISYSGLESIHRKEWKGWNRHDGIVKEDSVIHSIDYHRLILDEAHSIKQRTTSVARACFALRANYKWCLSGTPVQNRIGEFFSLLRFLEVRPFACYFCKQCKCQQLHWSQDAEKRCTECRHSGFSHVSVFNQEILNPITERDNVEARREALSKLRLITDRIMLRRVKRDHTASMELPPKRVILHNEFFGEIERDFSQSIMTNSTRQFDTYVSRGVMLNNYANIFGLIMQMRQVANHPDLILKKHAASGQNVLVCGICDEPAEEAIRSRCHHEFCRRCAKDYMRSFDAETIVDCPRCHIPLSIDFEQPDIEQEEEFIKKNSIINRIRMEDWTSSTKIEMLVYDLYKLRSKKQTHKSIVFSQFTSMLQLVEWRLRRAGFNTVMLDGSMTPAQRQRSIDYFMNNVDVEVFLVSLKAGGVALNLTEASRVFIVDPWWNPAAEWQSADRCHRIGQRRPCVITRLCIEDSVESRIVLLQEKKANLINGTINKDQGEALEKLTPEDMQFLFRGS
ncbi:putative DNA excision repair protein Rad16 [Aspergillus steynii IBT 23096]|uniref:Putative DNA excision repair protein Rad16 n=1 Tax=Aspergillus steynii IBT 23096 TaxID=1392250 RepID=A0A2I2GN16_9EURO|nr:putative DNA excision repair protein Rad16 [Aspergillus steynii IBT 23096]PLB54277.1 putative DNA excision repair protein Rad16 [Aspergillus steynii IBT 23096]